MAKVLQPFRLFNATVILPDRLIPGGALDVEDGRLTAVGRLDDLPRWSGATIDANEGFVAPGFVDLHVHGGDNADFMDGTVDAFEAVVRAHTRHGTTSIVATSTVGRHDQTLTFLENTRTLQRRGAEPARGLARLVGAHLYGPYFNEEKVGCHPKDPARPPTPDEYEQYLEFADVMLTATCAPELPGAAGFYRAASARGIRLNAGHSNATWAEMTAAHALGVRHVDHFYCAMSSVSSLRERCGTPMQASMLEFVLDHDDMTTEVIADGRHLSPELLRFVVKWKGAGRTALVTDCSRALDQPPGLYTFGPLDGGETFYNDGGVGLLPDSENLASSVRGMDFMVRHMHQRAGVDLFTAVRMASLTPATILGRQGDVGSLEAGKHADFLILNDQLEIRRVFVGGEEVSVS
ncbi:MAG TPA: amidohydrolase family protein [Vicinamibacterales bacterium]|nr:amidohydrolase family protein [Vicinamibacterales bacterium]